MTGLNSLVLKKEEPFLFYKPNPPERRKLCM
jgi:hypothetical protein